MTNILFSSLTQLHRYDDLEALLDYVTETIVGATGWSTAFLTFYFGDEAVFGASGCPEGTKERFRATSLVTSREQKRRKREEILAFCRPGTSVCYIPAGEGPRPGAAYIPSAETGGSWRADDRLIIMLRDWNDEILGLLSLDNPKSGDRPDDAAFAELQEIDTYVNLVAKVAENRFWSLRLEEREASYRGIFDAATDALVISELDGTVVAANPEAGRMFGYALGELVDGSARVLVHPHSWPVFETFLRETAAGRTVHLEGQSVRKDGTVLDIEVRGRRLQYRGQDRLLAIIQDVTERKRVLQVLLERQKEESIVAVAGGVAHDFNNLLMGITGSLDLLRRHISSDTVALRHCARIGSAAENLSKLTDQLLAIARGVQAETRPVSLSRVVEQSLPLVEGLVGTRFRLEVSLAPVADAVFGDRVQLGQLLLNLCQNGCEAMERGGRLRVTTEAVVREAPWSSDRTGTHEAGEYVRLSVADDGKGMDEETQRHIFDPYFSTRAEGSGLGLAAVHGIVRRHLGDIVVTSAPGAGTTVEVLLPRTRLDVADEPRPPRGGDPRCRVLLVDDDAMVLEVATEMLEVLGCEVVAADSGERALAIYEDRPEDHDVVLLDVSMPGQNGVETCEAIHRVNPEAIVVLTSGHTERLVRGEMAAESRAAGFLQKPYALDTLRAELDRVLES